jgi:hypothetical protein
MFLIPYASIRNTNWRILHRELVRLYCKKRTDDTITLFGKNSKLLDLQLPVDISILTTRTYRIGVASGGPNASPTYIGKKTKLCRFLQN